MKLTFVRVEIVQGPDEAIVEGTGEVQIFGKLVQAFNGGLQVIGEVEVAYPVEVQNIGGFAFFSKYSFSNS